MFHIFKYRFLCFIKNKTLIFWTLIFPVGLATLFFFAFSELGTSTTLKVIDIAVIEDGNTNFEGVIDALSQKNDGQLFNPVYVSEEKAQELIENKKVVAAIKTSDIPEIIYQNNSLNITIIREVIQSYVHVSLTIANLAQINPSILNESVIQDLQTNHTLIEVQASGGGSKDMTMQYFYTVIAMASLYGAFWGLRSMKDSQANQSAQAMRINVAPTPKLQVVLTDFIVSYILMVLEMTVAFSYMIFVLKVDFGERFPMVCLVTLCALFLSISLGTMVGCISKLSEKANMNMISMGSLVSSFLAGMMIASLPYMIDHMAPFVKFINPASLITNSFNMLYFYSDIGPVYYNMLILLCMGMACLTISYRVLRRKKYASI